jgi:hypothetical protein
MAISRFTANYRKVSTYSCRMCGHLTRDTSGEADVELCLPCYDLCGIENSASDDGIEDAKRRELDKRAAEYIAMIEKRGKGDAGWRERLKALLEAAS